MDRASLEKRGPDYVFKLKPGQIEAMSSCLDEANYYLRNVPLDADPFAVKAMREAAMMAGLEQELFRLYAVGLITFRSIMDFTAIRRKFFNRNGLGPRQY